MISLQGLYADRPLGKLPISLYTATSCGLDWFLYLFFATISITLGVLTLPSHEYAVQDLRLQYSYTPNETFPIWQLVFITIVCPPILFFAISCLDFRRVTIFRILWDTFAGLTALCGSMATQILIVCVLKNTLGLPRPDFLDRCQPSIEFGMGTIADCTSTDDGILREGFRTFPSGHSSTAFTAMTMVSLFSAGKLQVFDNRGVSIKIALVVAPMILASTIASSRIADNRHFLSDTLAGAAIGIFCAYWFYRQYFPSVLLLTNKGRAYPPRRNGVSHLFGNVGGFWFIEESDNGQYCKRCLNRPSTCKKLVQLGIVDHDTHAVSVGSSLEAASKAKAQLGHTVNLDTPL